MAKLMSLLFAFGYVKIVAWFLIIQQQISCLRIYKIMASLDRKNCLYVNLHVYRYVSIYKFNHGLILISSLFKDNEQYLSSDFAKITPRTEQRNSITIPMFTTSSKLKRTMALPNRRNRNCFTMNLCFRLVSIGETKIPTKGYLVELQSVVAKCCKIRKIDSLYKSIKNFPIPQSYIFPISQYFATFVIILVLVCSLWLWPLIFFSLPRYIRLV